MTERADVPALREFRVLTFDVVGTLIDFESGILDCVRRLATRRLDDTQVLEAFARAEAIQQRRTPRLPFTQLLEPICQRLGPELGLPADAATALRDSIPVWPAFPDAPEALRELGERFRLVALTNADNWALARMAETLGGPFHDGVTAQDAWVNKPDPQVFAYCLGRQSTFGYTRSDVLHVAQSQYHDIGAAGRPGYRTCWIERRGDKPGYGATPSPPELTEPDYHFGALGELAEAVRRC